MKSKIRNFQIQTRLGSGSYGVIFKAINKTDKSQCVLKQIRMSNMSDKSKKSTLMQATIMGKLIHPFIVQYKQSFVEDNSLNIVMQYCDNGDLSMFLKMQNKKPLKQDKIWKFFIQICMGLEYIHQNKILHRDIKTLNIFLNKNQDVKIGDLGVAKMLMANDFAQTIVGTPFYLSPQLCQEKPYNEKSDIWALGCLLYQLCTYKHPFQATNQASLILKIIRGKYSPIPEFYSKQLKDMIDLCLERDYKRRPNANMILTRPKIKQYTKNFGLEEKVKQQLEKIKINKQNKQPVKVVVPQKPIEPVEKINQAKQVINKPQIVANNQQDANKKIQDQKKVNILANKPSISGMPQKNIILPDKNRIQQKLQPNLKKPLQNKDQFLKNLERGIDEPVKNNISKQRLIKNEVLQQQKSRLQKIDNKIQQQLKKQKQVARISNQRKRNQTPVLMSPKVEKNYFSDRKSVPILSSQLIQNPTPKPSIYIKPTQQCAIPPLPPKRQQIIKVKMQSNIIAPKVYDQQNYNSNRIIKTKGFSRERERDSNQRKPEVKKNDKDINTKDDKITNSKDDKITNLKNEKNNNSKRVLFGVQQHEKPTDKSQNRKTPYQVSKSSQFHSQKNIKNIFESNDGDKSNKIQRKKQKQPDRYVFMKKPPISTYASSRIRKGSSNQISRNAKNCSKPHDLTKQDQDLVMNLPQSIGDYNNSSQQQTSEHEIKINRQFQLKDVNNSIVLQKYQEILSGKCIQDTPNIMEKKQIRETTIKQTIMQSKHMRINKNLNQYDENYHYQEIKNNVYHPQKEVSQEQLDLLIKQVPTQETSRPQPMTQQDEQIEQNQSLWFKTQQVDDGNQIVDQVQFEIQQCSEKQVIQNNIQQDIYQLNPFSLQQQHCIQQYQPQQPLTNPPNEWQYSSQPQLPLLSQLQSPFFQQANPYLIAKQQSSVQSRKNYLQIQLQENIKRQDQINKLMQIKMDQCRQGVAKGFQEILAFFRIKINMQDQYTEADQKEVDQFLRKKGLTDQRKFQNIYKIMHFQMELDNTRNIIQRICKKLAELDQTDN